MIKDLLLRNFKCFEHQRIPMRNLTLLTGLNGMGKSSVLQALLLLRQSYLDGTLPDDGLELNGSLVQMGTAKDILYEDAQQDEFEINLSWDDGADARLVLQYHREADVLNIDSNSVDRDIFSRLPFTDGFHYLQAERLGPRTTNVISDYQVRMHRQIGSSGQFAQHFLYVYGSENVTDERLLHDSTEAHDLRTQVQCWLHEISPGTKLSLESHPQMDLVSLRYSFLMGDQRSSPYRATSVGFGITYVLPVLIGVLSSKPGDLLIIENPEAHLHPRAQARIGQLLARAAAVGIQILDETHSDHILNGIRVAVHDGFIPPQHVALHYFSRPENTDGLRTVVQSPNLDKNGRLDQWPKGFFDEWDRSLESLLEPKGT
ncbi:MAG: DUF3696 domain-containing protein [Nitrospirota bacterium]